MHNKAYHRPKGLVGVGGVFPPMLAFRAAPPLALLFVAALVAVSVPVGATTALDCVKIHRYNAAESIGIRASPGREIEIAVQSTMPGNGIAVVALISPTLCTGVGLPPLNSGAGYDPTAPVYLPLP